MWFSRVYAPAPPTSPPSRCCLCRFGPVPAPRPLSLPVPIPIPFALSNARSFATLLAGPTRVPPVFGGHLAFTCPHSHPRPGPGAAGSSRLGWMQPPPPPPRPMSHSSSSSFPYCSAVFVGTDEPTAPPPAHVHCLLPGRAEADGTHTQPYPAPHAQALNYYNRSIQPLLIIGCAGGTDALSGMAPALAPSSVLDSRLSSFRVHDASRVTYSRPLPSSCPTTEPTETHPTPTTTTSEAVLLGM